MSSGTDFVVGITIGATLGAAYRSVFKDAKTRLKELGDAYKKAHTKLAAGDALRKYKTQLDQAREKQRQVGGSADKMVAAAEQAYEKARKAAHKYGLEVGNVVKKQEELRREIARNERQQQRLHRKEGAAADLGAIRGRAMAVGGLVYGFARLAKGAMAREEQAQYLRTVINAPDRDAAVGRAIERAREFSRRSIASDQEIIEIQYALHSAGFDEAEADAGIERVHKLAKVTRGQSGQVGEVFATTLNNMGEGMVGTIEEKMSRVANVLAKTQFKFQIRDFGQLGQGLEYASASAVAARVPIEDTAAVIGQLNSAGVQGSRAGTAFGAMMRQWSKAAESLGFSLARTDTGTLDLIGSLAALRARLGQVKDPIAVADIIQEAFGDEGKAAVVPLLEQYDALVAARDELRAAGAGNLVEEEYARFLEGGSAQWEMLGQNVRQVGEIFANTLLPPINKVAGALGRQAARVSELIERYPWVGRLIGGLALGLGLVTTGFAAMAGAVWLANAAMLANPVGLVVAGIVAAAAIIYSLWDPITEKVGVLWEKLKSLHETLSDIGAVMKRSVIGQAVRKMFGIDGDDDGDDALPVGARSAPVGGAAGAALAVGIVGSAAAAPDYGALQAQAAGIVGSFETARAAAPPAVGGARVDINALRAEVSALVDSFDTTGAPPPVHLTFNQTINASGDVEAEVGRQMERVMRRASVEAGLAESDDV